MSAKKCTDWEWFLARMCASILFWKSFGFRYEYKSGMRRMVWSWHICLGELRVVYWGVHLKFSYVWFHLETWEIFLAYQTLSFCRKFHLSSFSFPPSHFLSSLSHTQTHSTPIGPYDIYARSILLHYKNTLSNYFTTVNRVYLSNRNGWIYDGEENVYVKTIKMNMLQTFLWATGNEPDRDCVWSLYHFQG